LGGACGTDPPAPRSKRKKVPVRNTKGPKAKKQWGSVPLGQRLALNGTLLGNIGKGFVRPEGWCKPVVAK